MRATSDGRMPQKRFNATGVSSSGSWFFVISRN